MAPTLRGSGTSASGGTSDLVVVTDVAAEDGDLILIITDVNITPPFPTPACTGFTIIESSPESDYNQTVLLGRIASGDGDTYTITGWGSVDGSKTAVVLIYQDADSSIPSNAVSAYDSSASTTWSIPALTTGAANSIDLAIVGFGGNIDMGAPPNFSSWGDSLTELFDTGANTGGFYYSGMGVAHATRVSAGTQAATTVTSGNSDVNTAIRVEIKAATVSGSTMTVATGAATASTLAGKASAQSTMTAGAGVATAATLAGKAASTATLSTASGAATASTLAGKASAQSALGTAAGVASASTLVGSSAAASALSVASGAASASTLTGSSTAQSTMTAAAGVATASTLSSAAASVMTVADGAATGATMAGASSAQSVMDVAAGVATGATLSSAAASVMSVAGGSASTATLTGSSSAAAVLDIAAGMASAFTLAALSTAQAAMSAAAGVATGVTLLSGETPTRTAVYRLAARPTYTLDDRPTYTIPDRPTYTLEDA